MTASRRLARSTQEQRVPQIAGSISDQQVLFGGFVAATAESASCKPAAGFPWDAGLSDETWHLSAMLLGGVHEERVAEIDVACLADGVGKRTGMNLVRQRDVLVADALIAKGEKNVSDVSLGTDSYSRWGIVRGNVRDEHEHQ